MVIVNGDGKEPTKCRRCEVKGKQTVKPRYRMYEVVGVEGYICPECVGEFLLLVDIFRTNDED